jgi:hypothetical protein
MSHIGRRFVLSDESGTGIFCGKNGVFAGTVPLLEQTCCGGPGGHDQWQPRPMSQINRDLSKCFGLPIEFNQKIGGLQVIAQALSRGDIIHAQMATLHLEIPDPPTLAKTAQTPAEITDLARQLKTSRLLKADWDPAKHPRWPAGSPEGIGGEFAPAGAASDDTETGESSAPVVPAQITIPVPFDVPGGIPFPSEIVPPPAIPNINPRDLPRNPYPDRPECEQEWSEATDYCLNLKARNLLGRGDYRGSGRTLHQCIMGRVSQDCGGNSTGA